jgi:hypothetical protein
MVGFGGRAIGAFPQATLVTGNQVEKNELFPHRFHRLEQDLGGKRFLFDNGMRSRIFLAPEYKGQA